MTAFDKAAAWLCHRLGIDQAEVVSSELWTADVRRCVWKVVRAELGLSYRILAAIPVLGVTTSDQRLRRAEQGGYKDTSRDWLALEGEVRSMIRPLAGDLGAKVREAHREPEEPATASETPTLDEVTSAYLRGLCERHERLSDAAAEAGVTRHTLRRLLQRHGSPGVGRPTTEHDLALGPPRHGAYTRGGCRCPDCSAAYSAYRRDLRTRRQDLDNRRERAIAERLKQKD